MCSLMLLLKVLRTEIAQSQPLEKHIKKAASKDTDPYGLLRAALRWGSAQAAAAPPVQKPMDAARARVKALLAQPPQENANAANARELVHGLLHKEQ